MQTLAIRLNIVRELAPFALLTMLGMVMFVYGFQNIDPWVSFVGVIVGVQSVCFGIWLVSRKILVRNR